MQIAMAQINPRVGDLMRNFQLIETALADSPPVDLMVTPELATCGYPPLDCVGWSYFVDQVEKMNEKLISETGSTALLFGTLFVTGRGLHNGAILAHQGKEVGRVSKRLLPNYDVFDETRYFNGTPSNQLIEFGGKKLGVNICEDAWVNYDLWPNCPYSSDPIQDLVEKGATHLINLSASPYRKRKPKEREKLFSQLAQKHNKPVWHVNQVGANGELIFSGGSLAFDEKGQLVSRGPLFEEALVHSRDQASWLPEEEELFQALRLGLKDYLDKTGFSSVVVGVSGGIDSAFVLLLAASVLEKDKIFAVAMPGPYSSDQSLLDAQKLCQNLNVSLLESPIHRLFLEVEQSFQNNFQLPLEGIARQNAQARCRGQVLMNLANSKNALVLNTSNKSEFAVGYCTLLGDLCGALAVIGDLTKKEVYRLCRWYQGKFGAVPESLFMKPPSAELAPDQKDEDHLPPYPVLDQFVEDYVEKNKHPSEMTQNQFDPSEVSKWIQAIDRAEYKRKQAPPILRVTDKAFGMGRRRPIVQGFQV